jgi:YidC/Oxa1 family membrane protein insertase
VFLWEWLQDAVSWVLVLWHQFWSLFLDPDSGWAWTLSIVGLVVVIRILLIPLFVKQIRAQRNMQAIQPQLKEIQAKYAGDKERQSQEMMALYKETGTNPLSSCLPILLQAPIFFALFRVLQNIAAEVPVGVFKWDRYADLLRECRRDTQPHQHQDPCRHPDRPDVGDQFHHSAAVAAEEHRER